MARIHLIEGPVGAGKSTFSAQLSSQHGAPYFNLDDWMATLFSTERSSSSQNSMDQYLARKARCLEQICKVAHDVAQHNANIVLELGLIQKTDRLHFYAWVEEAGFELTVYVLEASLPTRKARVKERNLIQGDTFSMVVPDEIFDRANNFWETPDEDECANRDIRFHSTEISIQ